jgi:tRNA(Ile)-lysidine synthase
MLSRGETVGVAVSGGADSVCLLHVLLELAEFWELKVVALHLNHGLRGAESDEDAAFVVGIAERLGLPIHLRKVDLGGELASSSNLEEAGRHARISFFREIIQSQAVDCVAVGHTRSDQAETVLFRMLRGAGTAGLAAIRPVSPDRIVRPLLEVGRDEVEQFLRDRGIPWRDDSSNTSEQFARNRIRHQLLPQLAREWNPQIRESLANTADWALAEEAYWSAEIDRVSAEHLEERDGAVLVRADSLIRLPLAVGRRLVRRIIERTKGDTRSIDFDHVTGILAMAGKSRGSGRMQIPGLDILRSLDWLRFSPLSAAKIETEYSLSITVPATITVPGTEIEVRLEVIEKPETFGASGYVYNNKVGWLDWWSLSGSLQLRNWRPGDQYQPLGSTGQEKIKTLFQQARIPLWERSGWPILTDGKSIVWVRRFGVAAGSAAQAGTKMILQVRDDGS